MGASQYWTAKEPMKEWPENHRGRARREWCLESRQKFQEERSDQDILWKAEIRESLRGIFGSDNMECFCSDCESLYSGLVGAKASSECVEVEGEVIREDD